MSATWFNTGPSLIYVGIGSNGAAVLLGYTKDGADVSIQKCYERIMADILGPRVPQELQDFGEMATVRCPMISIDRTNYSALVNLGNRGAVGELNTPGRLVGTSGDSFKLEIAASADTPYTFYNAVVDPSYDFRMALTTNPVTIPFFCWPYLAANATAGVNTPLYSRTLV